ncbi:CDP-alcohol phosphatidyltransferase family protein [Elongatibacter sediminis]|uniref:CDP-diacylglycerol--glycerol-3-phosphate 3-phosphatidyltransferase n=1 Tax=Elongatibacter sediminis TaxID=3119006 RepID=A0AAW9RBY9_9GAMM
MSLRLLPNALTLFRMIAVGPIVYWLLTERFIAAFVLAMLAGVSDLLDGFLARRFGWMTHFGGVLDPLTDKLLLVSTTLTLAWLGHLPWWLVALVVARDVIIVSGGLYYHCRIARIVTAEPTTLSKWNTFAQIVLVVSIMLALAFPAWQGPWTDWLVMVVSLTTVASGVQYVVVWSQRARREHINA